MGRPKGNGNLANLRSFSAGPNGTGASIGRLGGIATKEVRLRRRAIKEIISATVACPLPDRYDGLRERLVAIGLPPTIEYGIQLSMIEIALSGRGAAAVEAARYIRDTLGEGPTSKVAMGPLQARNSGDISDSDLLSILLAGHEEEPPEMMPVEPQEAQEAE